MEVDVTAAGASVNCPKCGQEVTIPPATNLPTATSSPSLKIKKCPHCGKDGSVSLIDGDGSCVYCGKASLGKTEAQPDSKTSDFFQVGDKNCPFCGKIIWASAIICKFCSRDLVTLTELQNKAPTMPRCTIAIFLIAIAILDFIGGAIGGAVIGQDNAKKGWTIFLYCVAGGIFVLGFACALKYLHKIARHLESIEYIQRKTAK